MTKDRTFKRRVRDRMAKTGETYATARNQVATKRDRVAAARTTLADTTDRPTDDKVHAATGKRWASWFSTLDRWGARERTHRDTAAFLTERHDVPGWWAQTITVWYQRERGMRLKHQQPGGFTIYVSKTVAVRIDALFRAFTDARIRRRWLADGRMTLRASQPNRTARFTWGDGVSRVTVSFEAKGEEKSTVAVAHERLPDPDEAEAAKAAWRQRLAELKRTLEA